MPKSRRDIVDGYRRQIIGSTIANNFPWLEDRKSYTQKQVRFSDIDNNTGGRRGRLYSLYSHTICDSNQFSNCAAASTDAVAPISCATIESTHSLGSGCCSVSRNSIHSAGNFRCRKQCTKREHLSGRSRASVNLREFVLEGETKSSSLLCSLSCPRFPHSILSYSVPHCVLTSWMFRFDSLSYVSSIPG